MGKHRIAGEVRDSQTARLNAIHMGLMEAAMRSHAELEGCDIDLDEGHCSLSLGLRRAHHSCHKSVSSAQLPSGLTA